ncbi:hypothetical protein ABT124_51160 [Streptomyces sp. NPDC001982]|uniref:hypothetical protein n=1 Tax=Streptomyces sp. NPDC001982 TaxID=3154405 RepID=UPI003334206C
MNAKHTRRTGHPHPALPVEGMAVREDHAMAPGATPPAESGVSGLGTPQELYRRATKADVPGRSKMNRDQLIDALQHRTAT